MTSCNNLFLKREKRRIDFIMEMKNKNISHTPIKASYENILIEDIKGYRNYAQDPFMTTNINFRSAFQVTKYCCIYGSGNTKN